MGAHKLGCPNPAWMGLVDEQIVRRIGLCSAQPIAGSPCGIFVNFQAHSALLELVLAMDFGGLGDLTPRRGLVYDASVFDFYYALSEGGMRRGR